MPTDPPEIKCPRCGEVITPEELKSMHGRFAGARKRNYVPTPETQSRLQAAGTVARLAKRLPQGDRIELSAGGRIIELWDSRARIARYFRADGVNFHASETFKVPDDDMSLWTKEKLAKVRDLVAPLEKRKKADDNGPQASRLRATLLVNQLAEKLPAGQSLELHDDGRHIELWTGGDFVVFRSDGAKWWGRRNQPADDPAQTLWDVKGIAGARAAIREASATAAAQ